MAVAAIARLARANLRVPHDVSVVGFDDSDLATYTSPPLTTCASRSNTWRPTPAA